MFTTHFWVKFRMENNGSQLFMFINRGVKTYKVKLNLYYLTKYHTTDLERQSSLVSKTLIKIFINHVDGCSGVGEATSLQVLGGPGPGVPANGYQ